MPVVHDAAHMHNMRMSSAVKQKSTKTQRAGTKGAATYHGVRIPAPRGTSRFSLEEIKRAVDGAIAKNSGLFLSRK